MVRIPYIKIPSVRVRSIGPTSNIGDGGATPAPPTPITYLTQWRMMGNSTVHTDEYLTQWKVEGNSVVDNNTILSCGDLGQDGKYHVKISNGATIYDIPLTEPLRKVNDVADNIEFTDGVATVTRAFSRVYLGDFTWKAVDFSATGRYILTSYTTISDCKVGSNNDYVGNFLNVKYSPVSVNMIKTLVEGIAISSYAKTIYVYDENYNQSNSGAAFKTAMDDVELIYELETPTTEVIQVSPFPISPTDTYTSVNDTPYSAFEYKKNVEIWSCGEYSAVDGKYHILIQPLGGSIADIALDEPLRKVNDVADSIEFANGVGTLTRVLASGDMGEFSWLEAFATSGSYRMRSNSIRYVVKVSDNMLCAIYDTINADLTYSRVRGMGVDAAGLIYLYDENYNQSDSAAAFKVAMDGVEIIYELETPTTEIIQVPQIQEADSYTCVISQGGKAVSWSSFETNNE